MITEMNYNDIEFYNHFILDQICMAFMRIYC